MDPSGLGAKDVRRGEIRYSVKWSTEQDGRPCYTARARGYGIQCGSFSQEVAIEGLLMALASRDVEKVSVVHLAKSPCS